MSLKLYLDKDKIQQETFRLAKEITNFYHNKLNKDESLLVLVILKGSFIFAADLVRCLALENNSLPIEIEFISISSYGASTESSGQIRFELDTRNSISNKHVLIVEDIIDTGRSLLAVTNNLYSRSPKSIEITTLLSKPSRREVEVPVKFIGFTIPNEFVIGYGLDYNEKYRELPDIHTLTL